MIIKRGIIIIEYMIKYATDRHGVFVIIPANIHLICLNEE